MALFGLLNMCDMQSFCHWKASFHWINSWVTVDPIIFKDCVSILTHVYLVHKIALGDQSKFTVAYYLFANHMEIVRYFV